ncbi:viral A-type inclusion protein [Enterococcus asini]|uniref:viral A-type inclusion protein n=1 Tax=Enterococcus asini TaxID=57732 RepID=UPI0028926883|nr:viral A-type inclusion protein [Enterococcus asini]MDT2757831.1 viral A-type inclusion protein [Enterococcus asini]
MTEETIDQHQTESNQENTTFDEIKHVASANIGQMLQDLQEFDVAIKAERIPDIYRIYNGRLHGELKKTSNQNHEIDRLLTQKIHDSFMAAFPFMVHKEKISETMNYYTISEYYRERPMIGIDASIPEIFIIPKIDSEWQRFMPRADGLMRNEEIHALESELNELEAKSISAKSQLEKVNEELKELKNQEAAIENTKGFFNRGKVEEELEPILKRRAELEEKQEEWQQYVDDRQFVTAKSATIKNRMKEVRLARALVEKERRLIEKYFGSLEEMTTQINQFVAAYLGQIQEVKADD